MFISVTFRILSFRTLPFIPQKKIRIEFSANYPFTTFRIPHSAFRKIPLPVLLTLYSTYDTNIGAYIYRNKQSEQPDAARRPAVWAVRLSSPACPCKTPILYSNRHPPNSRYHPPYLSQGCGYTSGTRHTAHSSPESRITEFTELSK